jgi:hypothetical protein
MENVKGSTAMQTLNDFRKGFHKFFFTENDEGPDNLRWGRTIMCISATILIVGGLGYWYAKVKGYL